MSYEPMNRPNTEEIDHVVCVWHVAGHARSWTAWLYRSCGGERQVAIRQRHEEPGEVDGHDEVSEAWTVFDVDASVPETTAMEHVTGKARGLIESGFGVLVRALPVRGTIAQMYALAAEGSPWARIEPEVQA